MARKPRLKFNYKEILIIFESKNENLYYFIQKFPDFMLTMAIKTLEDIQLLDDLAFDWWLFASPFRHWISGDRKGLKSCNFSQKEESVYPISMVLSHVQVSFVSALQIQSKDDT